MIVAYVNRPFPTSRSYSATRRAAAPTPCHWFANDGPQRHAHCAGSQRPAAGCAPIARGWLPLCSLLRAHGDDGEGRACA